jgi:ABC-type branched-subunit amino acid transport system substrate-binding protein
MLGGGMVALPSAALKTQLGPQINGIVNIELWEPVPTMKFPGVMEFIAKYQARASAEGVDPLGYFLPPFAYAEMQVLGDAVEATKGLDEDKLAQYMHSHTFQTIVGDIAFGPDGEWTEARAAMGPVPRHQRKRSRAVQERVDGHDSQARKVQNGRPDLPLHRGPEIAPSSGT